MDLSKSNDFKKIVEISKKNSNCIALILFGSYASGTQKETSDLDLCIVRKLSAMPHDFEELNFRNEDFDIHFLDRVPDYIKFRIFSEGKVIILNDISEFNRIKRIFLHSYRDEYEFYQRNLNKVLQHV